MQGDFCVVDLETTGLYPGGHDRVVEVGLVHVGQQGKIGDSWSSIVNPERDVGPTHLHGISAKLARQAPTFSELSGDIAQFIHGRRLIAHNAAFDQRFLAMELERADAKIASLDALCTMRAAARIGLGRSLADCCAVAGITNEQAHSALSDALATAELFVYLLQLQAEAVDLRDLLQFPGPTDIRASHLPIGVQISREAAAVAARPPSILGRLVAQLPAETGGTASAGEPEYLELLDRVLEDREITDEELTDLVQLGNSLGLSGDAIAQIHARYMNGIIRIALADGHLSDAEKAEIEHLSCLLGVPIPAFEDVVREPPPLEQAAFSSDFDYTGKRICFTGASTCTLAGKTLNRDKAQALAQDLGMEVLKSVTKRLDILVVADPTSQSSKAKKARSYGTRIIAERSFWQHVGVQVD